MSKFKIGDVVIPERFERKDIFFCPDMLGVSGKPGCITNIDDKPDEHHYKIHGWWWPEGALTLHDPKEKEYVKRFLGQQTLTVDPERKTLGDFMLAALTGLCANPISEKIPKDKIVAEVHDMAQRAFKLYEKEVNDGK